MADHAGAGDPRRSMELSWGVATSSARGPKQALRVPDIVRTAIELADDA